MREERQHENLFGRADAGFVGRVQETLQNLERNEEEKQMKKLSLSMGLAIVLALVLLSTVAIAAASQLGALDFFKRYEKNENIDTQEIEKLIVTDESEQSVQTSQAAFRLREGIFDGSNLFLFVEAKPLTQDALFLGAMIEPEDSIEYMGPAFKDMSGTIADWGLQVGRTRVVDINMFTRSMEYGELAFDSWGADIMLEEDGTLIYMIDARLSELAQTLDLTLLCQTMSPDDKDSREIAELKLHFEQKGTQFEVISEEGVVFEDCGVRVDRVVLNGTPMATYYRIEYTVVDEAVYKKTDDGLWFEWIDESGERLPAGIASGGSVAELDSEDGLSRFVQTDTTMAMYEAPTTMTLRGYNAWEKNRYQAHEITFSSDAQ